MEAYKCIKNVSYFIKKKIRICLKIYVAVLSSVLRDVPVYGFKCDGAAFGIQNNNKGSLKNCFTLYKISGITPLKN